MGVDEEIFEVLNWQIGTFSVSCHIKAKTLGVNFRVVTIYGSSYEEHKDSFLSELHSLFVDCETPTLIGGDFNMVRYNIDKSNGRVDNKWCDKFNAWIEIWSLLEIKLGNRQFTWANNQADLIMSTIDRVFFVLLMLIGFFL